MNEFDKDLERLIKDALAPVADPDLRRDLWPEMRARLERKPLRIPWWDWALAAASLLALLMFPAAMPAVLYCF